MAEIAEKVAVNAYAVRTGIVDAYDIRYGRWEYLTAGNNPHPDPAISVRYVDNGLLLVFESTEQRDAVLATFPPPLSNVRVKDQNEEV